MFACVYIQIFFTKTSRPISIKLNINHPWVIQNCTNKGSGPLQREDNHKNTKIGWGYLKIFSSIAEPEELIFT
jgi:hypothetical protein